MSEAIYETPKAELNMNLIKDSDKVTLKVCAAKFNRDHLIWGYLYAVAFVVIFIFFHWIYSLVFIVFSSDKFKKRKDFNSGRLRLSNLSFYAGKLSYNFDKDHLEISNIQAIDLKGRELHIKRCEPKWANAIKIKIDDFDKGDLKEFLDLLGQKIKAL